jgi:membrane-associated phospholipid phosphatase
MQMRSPAFTLALILTFATGMPAQGRVEDTAAVQDATAPPEAPPSVLPEDPQDSQDAQEQPKENPPEPESHGSRLRWQDIPKNVLHDQIAIFTSPLHINGSNAKPWIVFGGATAVLIATTDQRVSNRMAQRNALTQPSTWASRFGSDYFLFPAWATFYVVGKAGDNPRARDTARLGIEALIDADITAGILKVATQRPRPEIQGESVRFFKGGDAFPSGHSIKAWSLARVVSREFSEKPIVPIVAYVLAATVSVARVGGRRHSPSDALAGAAMGFFIGDYVYRRHHAPSENSKPLAWVAEHVTFSIGP